MILATLIAETSITIDNVICAVDTGRTRVSDYGLETQGKCLLPTYIFQANLLQRKVFDFLQKIRFVHIEIGRAGRTQPSECYRLFTRCHECLFFADCSPPEMITSHLDNIY